MPMINGVSKDNVIKIVITQEIVDEYNDYYLAHNKRARKKPIEKPTIPSLNVWIILRRPMMNAMKQRHKNFIIWLINKLGYQNMRLNSFTMHCKVFMPSKRRCDCDNMTPKFWNDGFTESGFIVDDDYKHLHSLTIECGYDKDNPRTEIEFHILEDNIEENKEYNG